MVKNKPMDSTVAEFWNVVDHAGAPAPRAGSGGQGCS